MAKIGVFKKIAALATAIALVVCFAVSAGAVSIATTTTYVDSTTVGVNVTVTGIDDGANVTYYATNGSTPVHIDQDKVEDGSATFSFQTAAANLESAVKVGYTGASAAENAVIEGFTITVDDKSVVVPTEATSATIEDVELTDGYTFTGVSLTSGTIEGLSGQYSEGTLTLSFTKISSDATIVVNEEENVVITATAGVIEGAAVVVKANNNYTAGIKVDGVIENDKTVVDTTVNADKVGDRKLTVIGQVTNANAGYGIIVSEGTAIASGTISQAAFDAYDSYAGATIGDDGIFAIQLIDVSTAEEGEAFIKTGTNYYVAVYAKDASGKYVITANANAIQAQ